MSFFLTKDKKLTANRFFLTKFSEDNLLFRFPFAVKGVWLYPGRQETKLRVSVYWGCGYREAEYYNSWIENVMEKSIKKSLKNITQCCRRINSFDFVVPSHLAFPRCLSDHLQRNACKNANTLAEKSNWLASARVYYVEISVRILACFIIFSTPIKETQKIQKWDLDRSFCFSRKCFFFFVF